MLRQLIDRGKDLLVLHNQIKDEIERVNKAIFNAYTSTGEREFAGEHAVALLEPEEELHIRQDKIDDIRRILGPKFSEYVTVDIYFRPKDRLLALMADGDSRKGVLLRKHMMIVQKMNIHFLDKEKVECGLDAAKSIITKTGD